MNSVVNDVYLVKIGTSASTTLQMILSRYAARKRLKVASFNAASGSPYPKVASKLLLYEDVQQPHFRPYNVMHEQAVYDEITVAEYMRPEHLLLGWLEEPLAHARAYLQHLARVNKYALSGRDSDVVGFNHWLATYFFQPP